MTRCGTHWYNSPCPPAAFIGCTESPPSPPPKTDLHTR